MTVLEPVVRFLIEVEGKKITLEQVMNGAERPRKPVLRVLDRLVRDGYLKEIADNKVAPGLGEFGRDRRNPTWLIIKKPLAQKTVTRPNRRTVRDLMWQLMRARRRFTRSEIQRLGGVKNASAESFTKMLVKHGYLREIGKDSREKVFLLVKDAGPVRPRLKEVNQLPAPSSTAGGGADQEVSHE